MLTTILVLKMVLATLHKMFNKFTLGNDRCVN